MDLQMKNHFIINVTVVSALLLVSCTAEDIRNAIDQIKTDEQESITPKDGTVLSGNFALDNGSSRANGRSVRCLQE